jgi:peptidoglycan/xylan/chitin deacetylase (PgdA/CDA1 family)
LDEADVLIVYGERPPENMETIVIPSDSLDFKEWLKDRGLSVARKLGTQTLVTATPQTTLSIISQIRYDYDGSAESVSSISQPSPIRLDDDTLLLTLDIIEEYSMIMSKALNPKVSILYRFFTGLPISYTVAPKRVRNYFMKKKAQQTGLNLSDKLPLDALRFLLAKAIEEIAGKRLEGKMWNGKRYVCAMTHDIDTYDGLERAKVVKKLEEKYNIPSAWYIPTKQYKLEPETIQELENFGEIGAHDTRHDGKLVQLPEQKLIKRLRAAKQALENIINCSVDGFRAPLLQHSLSILGGLQEAGYNYDTSIPTWEPEHPQTMRPYGLGTMYPVIFDGVTEIPVSLIQDHQLLYALSLEPKEAIAEWLSMMALIKDLNGCCVFLLHPEYKLFDGNNLAIYEELLNVIASDELAWIVIPKQLVNGT